MMMGPMPCYVYLIQCTHGLGESDVIKVGISQNPIGRLTNFQTASPHRLKINKIWKFPSRDDARWVEKEFHETHVEQGLAGEWFGVSEISARELIDDLSVELWVKKGGRWRESLRSWLDGVGLSEPTIEYLLSENVDRIEGVA